MLLTRSSNAKGAHHSHRSAAPPASTVRSHRETPPLADGRRAVPVPTPHWNAGKFPYPSENLLLFPQPPHSLGFWYLQGVGKTTLVMRLLETLRASNPQLNIRGFYTSTVYPAFWTPIRCPFTVVDQQFRRFNVCLFVGEVRESGERVGFEVVTLDGRSGPLASSKVSRSGSACYYA
jgi:hypothetical protein